VNLARLYLSERPLWILDEPFTAIDVEGVAALMRRITAHARAGGAVLMTSHQAVEAEQPVRLLRLEGVGA
jgi:heme exporter protein A